MSEDKREKDKVLFISLVQSLAANCWIQLGKHINPVTGKLEKNLKEASFTIDLLDMLQAKTNGNLSPEEAAFLEKTISELKMNYVDEKMKEEKGQKKEGKEEGKEPSPAEENKKKEEKKRNKRAQQINKRQRET